MLILQAGRYHVSVCSITARALAIFRALPPSPNVSVRPVYPNCDTMVAMDTVSEACQKFIDSQPPEKAVELNGWARAFPEAVEELFVQETI
jgi:hypothetical protein